MLETFFVCIRYNDICNTKNSITNIKYVKFVFYNISYNPDLAKIKVNLHREFIVYSRWCRIFNHPNERLNV